MAKEIAEGRDQRTVIAAMLELTKVRRAYSPALLHGEGPRWAIPEPEPTRVCDGTVQRCRAAGGRHSSQPAHNCAMCAAEAKGVSVGMDEPSPPPMPGVDARALARQAAAPKRRTETRRPIVPGPAGPVDGHASDTERRIKANSAAALAALDTAPVPAAETMSAVPAGV